MILSITRNALGEGWCTLKTTTLPRSPSRRDGDANARRVNTMLAAALASRPLVGSSNTMMSGDVTSSMPTVTLLRSPPLTPPPPPPPPPPADRFPRDPPFAFARW